MSMSLCELLEETDVPDVTVSGLCEDSRAVRGGDVFVAVQGELADGHDFIAQAHSNGAVAVLCERAVESAQVPVVRVVDLKARRAALAARMYGEPSHRLRCIGVTGTNGKTTIAHFIADLAGRLGHPAGYLGTIGWGVPGALEATRLTTEGAITLHKRLRRLLDAGNQWAVLEVSSHALVQGRVAEVAFDVAVFSNLTRDHLDYHATQQAYGQAKARLFEYPSLSAAVINIDDPFGQTLAEGLPAGVRLITYGGTSASSGGRQADISWRNLSYTADGIRGRWLTPWGDADFELPLAGEFSVANMAAALATLCVSGLDLDLVVQAAANIAPVPGRMEFFRAVGRPTVVVDFAHTPDALDKALEALRRHTGGKLVCVIGCGGDRDPGKRPLMAGVAERRADVLWLTSDNPRSEDPLDILNDMARGLSGGACVHRCPDRGEAIARAVSEAGAYDLVVVAGKGHEDYQEVAGVRSDFSDREIVARLLGVNG